LPSTQKIQVDFIIVDISYFTQDMNYCSEKQRRVKNKNRGQKRELEMISQA